MSDKIWFDPTSDRWGLSDGKHYLEVPHWAREIIVNEFERETRQLKAENAKLRDELENARMRGDDLASSISEWRAVTEARGQTIDRLAAENAKLRELVRYIMHQCNDGNPRCDECIDWNDGECVALLRMRELGVEVDA